MCAVATDRQRFASSEDGLPLGAIYFEDKPTIQTKTGDFKNG